MLIPIGLLAVLAVMALASTSRASSSQAAPEPHAHKRPGAPVYLIKLLNDENASMMDLVRGIVYAKQSGFHSVVPDLTEKLKRRCTYGGDLQVWAFSETSLPLKEIGILRELLNRIKVPDYAMAAGRPTRTAEEVRSAAEWASKNGMPTVATRFNAMFSSDGKNLLSEHHLMPS